MSVMWGVRGTKRDSVRPPHVVIIVQNLPVPMDRRVWLEAQALVAAGYRVSVVCPKGVDPSLAIQQYKLSATKEWFRTWLLPWGNK